MMILDPKATIFLTGAPQLGPHCLVCQVVGYKAKTTAEINTRFPLMSCTLFKDIIIDRP